MLSCFIAIVLDDICLSNHNKMFTGSLSSCAVCLDGSPPGYHLHEGGGVNNHNWIVFLEV